MPTTTCFRIVNSFEQEGWIGKPDEARRGYRLSYGLLPLLAPFADYQKLFARAEPRLRRLAEDIGLCAKLSIRNGLEAVTVERAEPPQGVAVTSPIGARFPVVVGSSGAALLASVDGSDLRRICEQSPPSAWDYQRVDDLEQHLADCREKGFCRDVGSYRPGIAGISASVAYEQIDAAITLTGLTQDLDANRDGHLIARLLDAVANLEQDLRDAWSGRGGR